MTIGWGASVQIGKYGKHRSLLETWPNPEVLVSDSRYANLVASEQYAAFVAAIKDDPDSGLPRLVAADWFEQHGEYERCELIRQQLALAKLPEPPEKTIGSVQWNDKANRVMYTCMECRRLARHCPYHLAETKANELLGRYGEAWSLFEFVRPAGIEVGGPRRWLSFDRIGAREVVGRRDGREAEQTTVPWRWEWRRGFVEAVWASAADVFRHAPRLAALTPVREVRLTDSPRVEETTNELDRRNGNIRTYRVMDAPDYLEPHIALGMDETHSLAMIQQLLEHRIAKLVGPGPAYGPQVKAFVPRVRIVNRALGSTGRRFPVGGVTEAGVRDFQPISPGDAVVRGSDGKFRPAAPLEQATHRVVGWADGNKTVARLMPIRDSHGITNYLNPRDE